MKKLRRLLLAFPLVAVHGGAMATTHRSSPHIPIGETADAPSGFADMCIADPTQCVAAAPSKDTDLDPTPAHDEPISRKFAWAPGFSLDIWGSYPLLASEPLSIETLVQGRAPARNFSTRFNAPAPSQPFTSAALAPVVAQDSEGSRFDDSAETSMRLLKEINHRVNHNVRQTTDLQLYGVDELWRAAGSGPHAAGDCEDIALEKRSELIKAGVAADRLFLATVYVPGRGLHTIILARLPEGDFALDSLTPDVVRWDRLSYIWLRIQSPDNPMEWHRLGAAASTT